jgi:uncharacterized metal-binding protein YceD (DUF177 family)
MIIDLKSIDENGKAFIFDRKSEGLKSSFDDLLGQNDFNIEIDIKPLGNTFQVKGYINSHSLDSCSKCGYEIDVPLKGSINEIIVIEKARPRNTQVSQSQQNFDSSGPSVTYVNDSTIDLFEFLHEMIAANLNLYPICQDQQKCETQQFKLAIEEVKEVKVGHPGFAALKNLKVSQ